MKVLKQISTHKAIRNGNNIDIFLRGFDLNTIAPDGNKLFEQSDLNRYPQWFKDELLYTIPFSRVDDLFAIFERFEEDNRRNLMEANCTL